MRNAVVGVILALLTASPAFAHAVLVASQPADRAMIPQPPQDITLTFNEPVSPVALVLVRPDGGSAKMNDVTTKDQTLTIAVPGLANGTHLLSWRVISADGHPVSGTIMFSVGEVSAEPPMQPSFQMDRGLLVAIWLCKVALYCGLMFGIGGAFYVSWIAATPLPAGYTAWLSAIVIGGIIASVFSVGFQGLDVAGLPLSELGRPAVWLAGFQTSYGVTAATALFALMLGLAALHFCPFRRITAALALAGLGGAIAASGHAVTTPPQVMTRAAVFLHAVSVAFWIGALIPLLSGLRQRRHEDLQRFSRAVPTAIAILVATGVILSAVQIETPSAIWTTAYGAVWCAKICAVLILLGLGAYNRYGLTARAAGGDAASASRLAAIIRTELVIALAILCVVAAWRFTPPPRALNAAAAIPVQVHIHTAKAMADVKIDPSDHGSRTVMVAIWDGNFAPLAAKEVTLAFAKPDAGIEPLLYSARFVGDSTWAADGVRLPIKGRWRVTIKILVDDFTAMSLDEEITLQ